jgi:hypothetical protein
MKTPINEIKRMKKLAMIKENLENDDVIYNALLDIDHEQLVSDMLAAAESNPSLTLIDYLKKYDSSEEV